MFHKLLRYHFVRFVVVALALAFGMLAAAGAASAQAQTQLVPLVTDQTPVHAKVE